MSTEKSVNQSQLHSQLKAEEKKQRVMEKFLLLECLTVFSAVSAGILNPPADFSATKCFSNILEKYHEAYTLLIKNTKHFDFETNRSLLIYEENNFKELKYHYAFNMYIFLLEKLEKFNRTLWILYNSGNWNSRGKFLVLLDSKNETELDMVFKIAWKKYYIFNLDVIFNGSIYTFFPYGEKNCASYSHFEKISTCTKIGGIFPDKIPKNLQGCPVKMMPYILAPFVVSLDAPKTEPALSGVEMVISHEVAKLMNYTEVYVRNPFAHWGYKYGEGIFTLMFKSLYDQEIDIIFGFIYANYSYSRDFDASFCHLSDKSLWFFPTALQMAQWKNLTCIFEPNLWLAILIMFIINGVAWWLVGRNREKSDAFNDVILCVMNSLYILLQGSVKSPKRSNLRLIFFLWLFSCLMIFTAHQCQLISILTDPLYDKQMETLIDLFESKSEFGFYLTILDAYLNETDDWKSQYIVGKHISCNLIPECLNRTAFKRDFAVVKNIRQVKYLTPRIYSYPNGRPMLYQSEEVVFTTKMRYYCAKGFPLLEKFDHFLMLLDSSGLIDKWDKESVFKIMNIEHEPDQEPLNLPHLQTAFYVWAIGMGFALLICFFEKIFGQSGCCKNKNLAKRTKSLTA